MQTVLSTTSKNVTKALLGMLMLSSVGLHAISDLVKIAVLGKVAQVALVPDMFKNIATGVLNNVDPHRLEGISLKDLAKIAPTLDKDEINAYLADRMAKKQKSESKSLKDWFLRNIIKHRGFEKSAELPNKQGMPICDKNDKPVKIPYLKPTSFLSPESDFGKYQAPFIYAAVTGIIYFGLLPQVAREYFIAKK